MIKNRRLLSSSRSQIFEPAMEQSRGCGLHYLPRRLNVINSRSSHLGRNKDHVGMEL
jgi:hypothetical protein